MAPKTTKTATKATAKSTVTADTQAETTTATAPAPTTTAGTRPTLSDLRDRTRQAREETQRRRTAFEENQNKALDEYFAELASKFQEVFESERENEVAVRRGHIDVFSWKSGDKHGSPPHELPYNYLLRGTRDDKLDHFRERGVTPVQDRLVAAYGVDAEGHPQISVYTLYLRNLDKTVLRMKWA